MLVRQSPVPGRCVPSSRAVSERSERAALASSIVLVCRKRRRTPRSPPGRISSVRSRRSSRCAAASPARQHRARRPCASLDRPGMAIFSRYAKVVEADGTADDVSGRRSALINQALDETPGRAGGRLRRRHSMGARLVRGVAAWKPGPVRQGRDAFEGEEHGCQWSRPRRNPRSQGQQGAPARSHRASDDLGSGDRRAADRLGSDAASHPGAC